MQALTLMASKCSWFFFVISLSDGHETNTVSQCLTPSQPDQLLLFLILIDDKFTLSYTWSRFRFPVQITSGDISIYSVLKYFAWKRVFWNGVFRCYPKQYFACVFLDQSPFQTSQLFLSKGMRDDKRVLYRLMYRNWYVRRSNALKIYCLLQDHIFIRSIQ